MKIQKIILFLIIITLIGGALFLIFNKDTNNNQQDFSTLEESKQVAKNWITEKSPTYQFDGSKLNFKEAVELDLVDCEDCYQFNFEFESSHAGYGDRSGEMVAQVITNHEILVTVEHEEVTKAITDNQYNEIKEEFITNNNLEEVESYLKENITSLTEEEEVLGGNFMVNKILFLNDSSALVQYEDGHKAYVAEADFQVNPEIKVNKFTTLSTENITVGKVNRVDFIKSGNLKQEDGKWVLVYEEPGKPALTKELEITEESVCFDIETVEENETCEEEQFNVGDRVKVYGEEVENNQVQVLLLTFINK